MGIELESLVLEVPMLSSEALAGVDETTFELSVPSAAYNPQEWSSRHMPPPHQQAQQFERLTTASEMP